MRLGEHQLVRTLLLEEHGQPVERAGEPTGAGVDREPADHLDPDAAVRGAERPLEIVERRVVADEQEPPADARERHQLQRHRVVRGPQQGDRDRAGDDGGRDQPGGREVVVRAEAEREHDQGDEDESGEDPSGARSALARRVEAGLEEDDHRDRSEEREPVGRARLPEQRPVDRVAVDERAKDEREVDAEREARDVRGDESGDADRASDEAEDGAAREEVDARAPDVPGLARWRVRRGGDARLGLGRRRRGCLGRHSRILRRGVGGFAARDVRPRPLGPAYRRCDGVEVGRRPAPAEQRQAGDDQRPAAAVDEVGVVEVGVHPRRQPRPHERARQVAGAVRGRDGGERALAEVDPRGGVELGPGGALLRGRAAGSRAACSPRSRAPRRRARPSGRRTSRRRRRASARGRARGSTRPRGGHAPRSRRRSAVRASGS